MNDKKREMARVRAKTKVHFFRHITLYIVVIAVLILVNNLSLPELQWWWWPAAGWGLGILAHFLSTFVFTSRFERRIMEKELDILKEERSGDPR